MYHSVTFGSKNSYADWHLVPDSRPVIRMPELKTNYIEIPGASGTLDMSESLTKFPLYNNRSGDLKFHVLNDYQEWQELYQTIANYLHGKRIRVSLEDDSNYYYEGRVSISDWTSNNSSSTPWSDITFNYTLDPYKYWHEDYEKVKSSSTSTYRLNFDDGSLGRMPEIPSFVVSNIGSSGVDVTLNNPELGISNMVKHISTNGTHTFYDLVISNINGSNACTLTVTGSGYVKVIYKKGDL